MDNTQRMKSIILSVRLGQEINEFKIYQNSFLKGILWLFAFLFFLHFFS